MIILSTSICFLFHSASIAAVIFMLLKHILTQNVSQCLIWSFLALLLTFYTMASPSPPTFATFSSMPLRMIYSDNILSPQMIYLPTFLTLLHGITLNR